MYRDAGYPPLCYEFRGQRQRVASAGSCAVAAHSASGRAHLGARRLYPGLNPQPVDRLRRELGLTFIIASHDIAVVSYLCERLMVMRDGETIEGLTRAKLRPLHTGLVAAI